MVLVDGVCGGGVEGLKSSTDGSSSVQPETKILFNALLTIFDVCVRAIRQTSAPSRYATSRHKSAITNDVTRCSLYILICSIPGPLIR